MSARRKIDQQRTPANTEAERSVLGSLLIENGGYDQIASQLRPEDFYNVYHGRIYRVMGEVLGKGIPLDLVSLKHALDSVVLPSGESGLEDVGGPAYIASLVDGVPRSVNIRYYAEIVRTMAALRNLAEVGKWLTQTANDQQLGPHQIVNECDLKLTTLATTSKLAMGAVSVGDALSAYNAVIQERYERKGQIAGFPTGFPKLDLYTHGWQRRKMVVIAGQSSFGKSILALQTAVSIAQAGGRVVYYSYEMPRQDLLDRLHCQLSGIPLERILWGNIRTDQEWAAFRAAQVIAEALPLHINDGTSRSIADARAECRQIKAEHGLAAVVFDHFQLTDNEDGENRTQQLSNNSRRIQELGHELDIVTFTLSQMTVSKEDLGREPQLEWVKDCKSLVNECDMCLMLHPYKHSEVRDDVEVIAMKGLIRKNRGGKTGRVTLNLERDYVRFVEAEPPAKEPAPPKEPKAKKIASPDRW